MFHIHKLLKKRFAGLLPIVIDVETAGFNPTTDALLEIAAIPLHLGADGLLCPEMMLHYHILPFKGAHLDPQALAFTKIDPDHPLRFALNEQVALEDLFTMVGQRVQHHHCRKAVLVGHNAAFDLSFIQAAGKRHALTHNPFHAFTTLDTATLSAVCLGETVLARALAKVKIPHTLAEAHCALYDAQQTAKLFCALYNQIYHSRLK